MTVVNPKSISGINSITTGSGSDDILTIHTNNGTERLRVDSTGTTKIVTGIVTTLTATTGIVTTLTANTVTSLGAISGTTGTFSGDVDIADKIVHTGDTNTAIRFPAADTVTVETGGSERIRVDSDGRSLVGTTSNSNAVRAVFQGYTGGGDNLQARVQFQTNQATNLASNNHLANLLFTNASGSVGAQIDVKADAAWGTDDYPARIEFKTTADGASSPTERLRIDSSGHLSFAGTTEEITLQTSDGSDTGYLNLSGGGACAQTRGAQVVMSGNERSGGLGGILQLLAGNSGSTGVIQFFTGGAEKMRLQSGGGISFNGDTATNNALDDYEEGTWTPTQNGFTNGGTNDNATYVKIGQTVQIGLNLFQTNNNMSWVAGAWIGGLPFAPAHLQGVFIGGYNNKDTSGAYIVSDGSGYRIILMAAESGVRHLWTTFVYRTTQSGT